MNVKGMLAMVMMMIIMMGMVLIKSFCRRKLADSGRCGNDTVGG